MRLERVKDAWAKAYAEIAQVYGSDGPTIDEVRAYAPAMAAEIEAAEADAEAASVAWVQGGRGGVQAKIDKWRDKWLEAILTVRAAA